MCAQGLSVREKVSCEVYLSTLPVGYSGSLSTVNETHCNKHESAICAQEMFSLSKHERMSV